MDQQRKARFNSEMYGAMPKSDSAARDEQDKAGRSDSDVDDANRLSAAAIEIRHALSDAATDDAAPIFIAGAALFRAESGILGDLQACQGPRTGPGDQQPRSCGDEEVTAEGGDCAGDNQAEAASAAGAA